MDLIWQGNRLLVPGGNLHIGWVEPPVGPINRLTGFVNGPSTYFFDTLVTSGIDITSAIEASGNYGKCRSNTYPITGSFENFGTISFTFYLTLNSGQIRVEFYRDGISHGSNSFSYTGPKDYTVSALVGQSANWAVGFSSGDTNGLNFTATNCRMYVQNGI